MKIQNVLRALPTGSEDRKRYPVTTGVLDYFPMALVEIAFVSKAGNDQHNPGQPLHWARAKSSDHADCVVRHLIQRGTCDSDGVRHTAKAAWRALALLQEELEAEAGWVPDATDTADVEALADSVKTGQVGQVPTDLLKPAEQPVSAWEQLTKVLHGKR